MAMGQKMVYYIKKTYWKKDEQGWKRMKKDEKGWKRMKKNEKEWKRRKPYKTCGFWLGFLFDPIAKATSGQLFHPTDAQAETQRWGPAWAKRPGGRAPWGEPSRELRGESKKQQETHDLPVTAGFELNEKKRET